MAIRFVAVMLHPHFESIHPIENGEAGVKAGKVEHRGSKQTGGDWVLGGERKS